MARNVVTTQYVNAHGHTPKGNGVWFIDAIGCEATLRRFLDDISQHHAIECKSVYTGKHVYASVEPYDVGHYRFCIGPCVYRDAIQIARSFTSQDRRCTLVVKA